MDKTDDLTISIKSRLIKSLKRKNTKEVTQMNVTLFLGMECFFNRER